MQKKKIKEKTIGILGGMGPYATLDFFHDIIELTPAKKDWEHLHIIIDNNVKIPSRTRSILYHEKSPVPEMIRSINNLAKAGADIVVVPCNSAHYFYDEVVSLISIPWLHMIETVSTLIPFKKPLILGGYITTKKKLYSKYFPKAVYPSVKLSEVISQAIETIKLTGRLPKNEKTNVEHIIKKYSGDVDSVILACTELPIEFSSDSIFNIPMVNANKIYAEKIIHIAKNEKILYK